MVRGHPQGPQAAGVTHSRGGRAALFGAPPTADAGAWTQPKGGGYLKTWIRFQAAIGFLDGYHDDNGDFRYTGNYSETGIHFYGEYAMVWLMEGGYRFHPKVYATVRIVQLLARGPVEPLPNTGSPSGVTNGTSYFAFSFEVDYLLNEHGLSIGVVAEGATFYERQAGGPVFNLYLAKKWDGSKSRR